MPLDPARARQRLQNFDFTGLFVQELGWDRHRGTLSVVANGSPAVLQAVAEKRGMQVFECVHPAEAFPDYAQRRKIEQQVAKSAYEHILIFTDDARSRQYWQWVRREPGKPLACREQTYFKGHTGDPLIQRLQRLAVDFAEEETLSLVDVIRRARQAFDVDRVTKPFYDRFKSEHAAFLGFIKGITASGNREWYASLMLNRLMFIYFIQKKGFLDGDIDYLRHRLQMVRQRKGKDKFLTFYRYFLVRLFHEGLNLPPDRRSKELDALLGRVPYLNGGLFDVHDLEKAHPDIQIADQAFEKLFDFFDAYQWHLDERPLRADNEINPDVLGYIFEKYINQKQMGAYYTKEDITGYIARNTVIPFLFDAAEMKCAVAFQPDSALWRLLRDDADRYIYPSVRHGVDNPLPPALANGLEDFSKRTGWNGPATPEYGLPTETWREFVARRQRCHELRDKLCKGEVHAINDLITYNLDICQFAEDAVENCEGPELLRAFYQAIEKVAVLDPTCGSGAFLFAALNILEPFYDACLERMQAFVDEQAFVDDLAQAAKKPHSEQFADFRRTLEEVARHPNRRYFILKSIIVNNLYGVDIMEEAVEICKLRLFLKLVAQVGDPKHLEPLPDIDFNIRPGNTLVGFATLREVEDTLKGKFGFDDAAAVRKIVQDAAQTDEAFQTFHRLQTQFGAEALDFSDAKDCLRRRIAALRDQLDRYQAGVYDIDADNAKKFAAWRESHQPFHWLVEFYGIMNGGGFDVIIGNPPYVASRKVSAQYGVTGYQTEACPDIYAWCLERVAGLLRATGRSGMIVPLSLGFSEDFQPIRKVLFEAYCWNWFSSFGRIPSALFSYDVRIRNTIHLGSKKGTAPMQHTSRLHRWFEEARPDLLLCLEYFPFSPARWKLRIPKLNSARLGQALEYQLGHCSGSVEALLSKRPTPHVLYSKKTAYNWLAFSRKPPPCFDARGKAVDQSQLDTLYLSANTHIAPLMLLLNGKLIYAYWCIVGDDFHVTKWNFAEFPLRADSLAKVSEQISRLANELERKMHNAVSFKLNAGKKIGSFNLARCRQVTDRADRLFAELIGIEAILEDVELYCSQVVKTSFAEGEDEE